MKSGMDDFVKVKFNVRKPLEPRLIAAVADNWIPRSQILGDTGLESSPLQALRIVYAVARNVVCNILRLQFADIGL